MHDKVAYFYIQITKISWDIFAGILLFFNLAWCLTLKVPEKLQLYGLYVYYVVHTLCVLCGAYLRILAC